MGSDNREELVVNIKLLVEAYRFQRCPCPAWMAEQDAKLFEKPGNHDAISESGSERFEYYGT